MLQPIITFTSCPDMPTAQKIAEKLVTEKLAACVSIIDGVKSVYCWEGKLQQAPEVKLMIKTVMELAHQVEVVIKMLHPYEVPEITAVEMAAISEDYFHWVSENIDVKDES